MTSIDAAPLLGVTVVSLEHAVAAPLATRHLADLGARVIKVERPGTGDFARSYDHHAQGLSSYFVWLNRGKESAALDLKDRDDRKLLDAILASADVLVQNLAPGAAERLGLDAANLRRRRPELVVCTISGYGDGGPYERKKAYDLLIQCEAGVLSVTGTPADEVKVGFSVADIASGMYAFSSVLAALLRRERTGQGASVSISMLEALAEWMSQPFYLWRYSGRLPARTGASHVSIAPYGPVAVRDGRLFLGVQNDREWRAMCAELLESAALAEDPRFITNSQRVENRDALAALLHAALADVSVSEAEAALDELGIANARLRTVEELATHPQLAGRERWMTVDSPVGPLDAMRPPHNISGHAPQPGPVPDLGEHTAQLRNEFLVPLPASVPNSR